jgi:hypothetical protein
MVRYRRNVVAGATYFFTVTLRDRRATWLVHAITDLRAAFREAKQQQSFEIIAIAVMPEHLHAVIRMAGDDADYAKLWRTVKGNLPNDYCDKAYHCNVMRVVNMICGNVDFGNTPYAMIVIYKRMLTTFISTPLSMVWLNVFQNGLIHRFTVMCVLIYYQKTGRLSRMIASLVKYEAKLYLTNPPVMLNGLIDHYP